MTEKISICPVCGSGKISHYLEVKDYFLSQENFSIQECNSCSFRFVNPRPVKEEIGRYYQSDEYISHDAGKTDILSRIYKLARRISIRRKFGIVKNYCQGGKILDIGCGTGEFLKYCQLKRFNVTGVEPNDKARDYAQKHSLILTYKQLELLEANGGSYNCITMWHVLEHIHDLNGLLSQVKKLLSPDGIFIVAVPNSNSWDAARYKNHWAAYDVPRHLYHFTKSTLLMLVSKHGLKIRKIYPQKLDAYYVSMLSEKYQSGKTKFLKSFFHGIWSNCQAKNKDIGHSSLIFVMSVENA